MSSHPIINTNLLMEIHVLPLQIFYSYSCDDGSSLNLWLYMLFHMQCAAVRLVCFPGSSNSEVTTRHVMTLHRCLEGNNWTETAVNALVAIVTA